MGTIASWIVDIGVKMIGTKFAKKLAKSIVRVIVKRTDNTWDDEILEAMEKK